MIRVKISIETKIFFLRKSFYFLTYDSEQLVRTKYFLMNFNDDHLF